MCRVASCLKGAHTILNVASRATSKRWSNSAWRRDSWGSSFAITMHILYWNKFFYHISSLRACTLKFLWEPNKFVYQICIIVIQGIHTHLIIYNVKLRKKKTSQRFVETTHLTSM